MKQTKGIYCESSKDSEKCIFFHKAHNIENMKYGTDSVRLWAQRALGSPSYRFSRLEKHRTYSAHLFSVQCMTTFS